MLDMVSAPMPIGSGPMMLDEPESKKIVLPEPASGAELQDLVALCQELHKLRMWHMKSRIMLDNRVVSSVKISLGYNPKMSDAEKLKYHKEALAVIKKIKKGESLPECGGKMFPEGMRGMVEAAVMGVEPFKSHEKALGERMEEAAARFPVAAWSVHKEQRGFGLLFLAMVIGTTGDLNNYGAVSHGAVAKVWKRLGMHPIKRSSDGVVQSGCGWKKWYKKNGTGALPAEDWSDAGYSPVRRSVSYQVGKNLMMLNYIKDKETEEVVWMGEYRRRFEEKKALLQLNHPDYPKSRCNSHGMLLAGKLLIKKLVLEWTGSPWVEWSGS